MNDEATAARFDGRPSVEFDLSGFSLHHVGRITSLATELGYRLDVEERAGQGRYRLRYTRDDSPIARQRAAAAMARVRATGSWLAVLSPPVNPAHVFAPDLITPLRATRAERYVAFHEETPAARTPLILIAVAAGFAVPAVAVHETLPLCVAFGLLAAASLVGAALAPRLLRKRYDANLRLVEEYRRQQAERFPVRPPVPAPPFPASGSSGERAGE